MKPAVVSNRIFRRFLKHSLGGLAAGAFSWDDYENIILRVSPRYEDSVWTKTAASFASATSEYLNNSTANFRSSDSAGSIEAWLASGFKGTIFSSSDAGTDEQDALAFVVADNRLRIRHISGDDFNAVCSSTDLPAQWNHVTVTADGSDWKLYLNGSSENLLDGFPEWTRWNWNHFEDALVDLESGASFSDSGATFGSVAAGSNKWTGAVEAPNGMLYCIPRDSTSVLKINPTNDTVSTFGSLSGSLKWLGGVLAPNGMIYGIPTNSTTVLKIDPTGDSTSTFGSLSADTLKWFGGVLAPNGMIYGIPFDSTTVLKIDPTDDTVSTFGSLSGTTKWVGGVLAPNGMIYGIPYSSTTVLKINPTNDTTSTFGSVSGTVKYFGGAIASNGMIYGFPNAATTVLKINPSNDTVSTFGSLAGGSKWHSGALAPNGMIYGSPEDSTTILKIDPSTDTASTFGSFSGTDKYQGSVLSRNGNIYCVPSSATTVLKIGGTATDLDPAFPMSRAVNKL
jgi:hypothetical protein